MGFFLNPKDGQAPSKRSGRPLACGGDRRKAVRSAYRSRCFSCGLRVLQERTSGGTPAVAYTRGLDLSGTFEGAGGIGGLLARSHGYSGGNWSTHNFYHADGNGNITCLINSSQSKVAEYQYDPYGRTIYSSGSLAGANLYRFSSKEVHTRSGFCDYGYRWYDPVTHRWPNRDPIGQRGGINLYTYVGNNPPNFLDPTGTYQVIINWILRSLGRQPFKLGLAGPGEYLPQCWLEGTEFIENLMICRYLCTWGGYEDDALTYAAATYDLYIPRNERCRNYCPDGSAVVPRFLRDNPSFWKPPRGHRMGWDPADYLPRYQLQGN